MLLGLARPSSGGIITARYAYGEIWDFFQTDSAIIDTLRIVAIFVLVFFAVLTLNVGIIARKPKPRIYAG